MKLSCFQKIKISLLGVVLVSLPSVLAAQSITGTIRDTIDKGATLLMLILVGAAAWAGFEMKSGNPQAITKLIYCITAIVIVGSANALVSFFKV